MVLIVGENDQRTVTQNARFYYERLKALGKNCELYSIPDGAHYFYKPHARCVHMYVALKNLMLWP